jgi:hypothetical protein
MQIRVLALVLAMVVAACKRSHQVTTALDAGTIAPAKREVVCVEQPDGCLRCADRNGEAPFLDAEQTRPTLCDPKDPEDCFEFCSVLTADCAMPWWQGAGCVEDTELEFDRARFNLATANLAETMVVGRVVDETGKRIEGAKIRVWLARGPVLTPLLEEKAGKDGVFRLRLKTGPWTYALRFSFPGLASEVVERFSPDRPERPSTAAAPRVFRMGPEHLIRGRVVDKVDGNPVVGASVAAVRSADDALDLAEARTAEDGGFVLGGLEAKRYFLRVSKFGWRPLTTKAPIAAPAAKVVLRLTQANAIQGVVVDRDGEPEPNATVAAVLSGGPGTPDFTVDWRTDAEGRFAEDNFAGGTYYVWARRGNMLVYPPEKIELAESQGVEVRLVLSHRGARVSGTVVVQNGMSLGGEARD